MTTAIIKTELGFVQAPRGPVLVHTPGTVTPVDTAWDKECVAFPASPNGLVERAMLFALDRDCALRARYLRQRWRHFSARHA